MNNAKCQQPFNHSQVEQCNEFNTYTRGAPAALDCFLSNQKVHGVSSLCSPEGAAAAAVGGTGGSAAVGVALAAAVSDIAMAGLWLALRSQGTHR